MRRTMLAFMVVTVLTCTMAAVAAAWDTSPYLVGKWEYGTYVNTEVFTQFLRTEFEIINTTTKMLTVYAVFRYEPGGVGVQPLLMPCTYTTLYPNAVWELSIPYLGPEQLPPPWPPRTWGSAKFFAFPAGTTKFDPNALIGGFQKKQLFRFDPNPQLGPNVFTDLSFSEANLKAVIINSYTVGEFTTIPFNQCFPWVPIPPPPPPPPPFPPYWPPFQF